MTPVLDPSKPFSAELNVIRRLNSSLYRTNGRTGPTPGCANSPSATFHAPVERLTLAPLRKEVPLLDPCCGQLSAGAEVDLGIKGRPKFIDFHHVASALWVPRPETAPNPSGDSVELGKDKAWNSRRNPDAVLRACLSGSTNPVKDRQNSQRTLAEAVTHSSLHNKNTGSQDNFTCDRRPWTDNSLAVQRFTYTSTTQRSYEEVCWHAKLPRCLTAQQTTLEKMADPVCERPSSRRYNSRPQLWQSIGAEWNRKQLRLRNDAKKPISFCSGCPRSGQIPLYTGMISSENMNNIDNMDEVFHPLTQKRSIIPPYTPTACRTTVPGYTGRAAYADAVVSVPAPWSPAHSSGTGTPVSIHVAPLSRMVTTTAPCNPYLRPALPISHMKRH